jgi:hypothetical protein
VTLSEVDQEVVAHPVEAAALVVAVAVAALAADQAQAEPLAVVAAVAQEAVEGAAPVAAQAERAAAQAAHRAEAAPATVKAPSGATKVSYSPCGERLPRGEYQAANDENKKKNDERENH